MDKMVRSLRSTLPTPILPLCHPSTVSYASTLELAITSYPKQLSLTPYVTI